MKKRIGIALIIIAIVALIVLVAISLSKKGSKDAEPAAISKTVDLGETDEDDAEVQKDVKDGDNVRRSARGGKHIRKANKLEARANKDDSDKADADKANDADEGSQKAKADDPKKESGADNSPEKDDPAPEKGDGTSDAEKEPAGDEASDDADNAPNEEMNFDDPEPLPEVRRPKPRVGLDIEKLINIRELREQTGYSGALSDAWLLGQTPDDRYNAMRLSTDDAKDLGFAIQVWKPGNESAASKRFNDLYAQSFGGKKLKAIATDAFTASHHDIHELGFYDKTRRTTVLLSCSSKVCTLQQLQSIALTIQRRL